MVLIGWVHFVVIKKKEKIRAIFFMNSLIASKEEEILSYMAVIGLFSFSLDNNKPLFYPKFHFSSKFALKL